ncbi:6,7-dimethyl-8-ribityllumazine synthase [Candidatus Gracilibacteria bacterium]|nr:6,7-dimethyl-8-ribityllumazine synthase [Candidatus Gracilibacteria bacterium]
MAHYTQELISISHIPKNIRVAFISADFNKKYTDALEEITEEVLTENHFRNITKYRVPGAFEIPAMIERVVAKGEVDLIYCFGVVIRGATTHYDYVCNEAARGIMEASVRHPDTPIIFGLLTCENIEQVEERINKNLAISGLNLLAACKEI